MKFILLQDPQIARQILKEDKFKQAKMVKIFKYDSGSKTIGSIVPNIKPKLESEHDYSHSQEKPRPLRMVCPPNMEINPDIAMPHYKLDGNKTETQKVQADTIQELRMKVQALQIENIGLQRRLEEIQKVFRPDQMLMLCGFSTKVNWQDETYKDAIAIRDVCGAMGYDLVKDKGFPLPSRRAVDRYIRINKLIEPEGSIQGDPKMEYDQNNAIEEKEITQDTSQDIQTYQPTQIVIQTTGEDGVIVNEENTHIVIQEIQEVNNTVENEPHEIFVQTTGENDLKTTEDCFYVLEEPNFHQATDLDLKL